MTHRQIVVLIVGLGVLAAAPAIARTPAPQNPSPAATPARVCVAIVLPSVHGVEGHAIDVANATRDLFASYLSGPSIQAQSLEARLPSQALEEARLKPCLPLLTVTLTLKHGGGGLGKAIGQAAGASAWYIPYGSTVGSAAAHAGAAVSLHTVSSLAATTKAKDELRIEYKLQDGTGRTLVGPATDQIKAKTTGEDLLTPLVEKAATAIAAAVAKK